MKRKPTPLKGKARRRARLHLALARSLAFFYDTRAVADEIFRGSPLIRYFRKTS